MPKEQSGTMLKKLFLVAGMMAAVAALSCLAQSKPVVIEEVIARVNSDAITRGDLEHARSQLRQEAQQDCPKCTADEINAKVADGDKNLLRDLIDNSLLVQEGKDGGVSVDADVIKRLDEIRIQNNIATMEELEEQIDKSGVSFEDFKNNIKNQLLQQEVIRHDVGSKIILSHEEVQKYYQDHKDDFVRPELVTLREIFVSTEGKTDSDMPALRKKAEDLLQRQHGQARRRPGPIPARPARSQYRTGGFWLAATANDKRDPHQDWLPDSASGGALLRGSAAGG
jgi:peptidyl-prolyl cis-trans isomerase SurA